MESKSFSPRTIKRAINSTKAFSQYINTEFKVEEFEEITHLHIKKYIAYMLGLRTHIYFSILKYDVFALF